MLKIEKLFYSSLDKVSIRHNHSKVVVGFSGGPDSMAISLLCEKFAIPAILAHLDHSIRPGSANENAYLANFASAHNFEYTSLRVDVPNLAHIKSIGLEDAGRRVRMEFLENIRIKFGCDWILTGHQADDLAEDVILRIIRGVGWPSLAGMEQIDQARHLLRPLLFASRTDIESYVLASKNVPILDPTNDEDEYRRNRIRHHIIPRLKAENPLFLNSVLKLWNQARDDDQFWRDYLSDIIKEIKNSSNGIYMLSEARIKNLPRAARTRALLALFHTAGVSPRADAIDNIDCAIQHDIRPKCVQLAHNASCTLSGGMITVKNEVTILS